MEIQILRAKIQIFFKFHFTFFSITINSFSREFLSNVLINLLQNIVKLQV